MREHPILFSTPMVQAILEGRKTQTRRVVKAKDEVGKNKKEPSNKSVSFLPSTDPECFLEQMPLDLTLIYPQSKPTTMNGGSYRCPYGQIGDRLWVRETFCDDCPSAREDENGVCYKANRENQPASDFCTKWKPSIFMPRWASRITLEITNIKVERLQDIDELGALNEGTPEKYWDLQQGDMQTSAGIVKGPFLTGTAVKAYSKLWDSINGKKHSWESNPWCWCIEFKRIV